MTKILAKNGKKGLEKEKKLRACSQKRSPSRRSWQKNFSKITTKKVAKGKNARQPSF